MSIITLTTDLGTKDHYLASIKGKILSLLPSATLVDVSHNVDKYNIVQGAFVIKNCFSDFPDGTVHIVSIQSLIDNNSEPIVLSYQGHFFVGVDNGIFSLILDSTADQIYRIELQPHKEALSFPTKEILAPAACHIAKGGKIELLGSRKDYLREMVMIEPVVQSDFIRGSIQYIDSFGNLITNISKGLFVQVCQNRSFSIAMRSSNFIVRKIVMNYNQVPEGELLAIFGSNDYLEIAIHSGPASSLLGLRYNDLVSIEFYEN